MRINKLLQNLQLNWQAELQKDEWFFAKERDKIDDSFTAEEAFSAIMEVVLFIQFETNANLPLLFLLRQLLFRKIEKILILRNRSAILYL